MSEANTDMTVREIPVQRWGAVALSALAIFIVSLSIWEWRLRTLDLRPADFENLKDTWAFERRRLDAADAPPVVILGSSRILFDTRFDEWEALTGVRPLMLAIQGTPPWVHLNDIAVNTDYRGLVLVGVDPDLFFGTWPGLGAGWLQYSKDQTPAQRSGHILHRALDGRLAFLDPEYRLVTLLERLPAPQRLGMCGGPYFDVWKILASRPDREIYLWPRIERDEYLREQARAAWCVQRTRKPETKRIDEVIANTRRDVDLIRARGGEVVFIRAPSTGGYLEAENREMPRAATWDRLIAETNSFGIHFEDYAAMQGLELPEWSHLTEADSRVFTRAYVEELVREMAARGRPIASARRDP
jgi:hypothetical protein